MFEPAVSRDDVVAALALRGVSVTGETRVVWCDHRKPTRRGWAILVDGATVGVVTERAAMQDAVGAAVTAVAARSRVCNEAQRLIDDLRADATEVGLVAYRDPACRDRVVIVDGSWDLADLAAEVARPGGMRVSPHFIGPKRSASTFLAGVTLGRNAPAAAAGR